MLRQLNLNAGLKRRATVVAYLNEMVDRQYLEDSVVSGLMRVGDHLDRVLTSSAVIDILRERVLTVAQATTTKDLDDIAKGISAGNCAVLVDGCKEALVCQVQGWKSRSIQDPTSESTISGPKEGFVESLDDNVSLLRRYILSNHLRVEYFRSGRVTATRIALAYVSGIASDRLAQEGRRRLSRIDVEGVSSSLEEHIEDGALSLFPTLLRTQRTDRAIAALLEGRLVFLVDGNPDILVAPATISMFLSSPEDYYERFWVGTSLRIVRMMALLLSLLLPGLYVAVTTFHQESLPTRLILAIAAQREGIPFPALVEALLIEVLFEILREAGVRLPRIQGPAVSIIGALILGDAAIRARLVSPAMVVVVAATGVSSFVSPATSFQNSIRILRFAFIIAAAAMGIFGMSIVFFVMLIHLNSLRSFGVPYLEPYSPTVTRDFSDSLVRAPQWARKPQPWLVWPKGGKRSTGPRPGPPKGGNS